MTKLVFVLGFTLTASALAVACSSSPMKGPGAIVDGGGGAAGETSGGAAGTTEPGGCVQHADCESFGDCDTLSELESYCPSVGDLIRYASSCGGTYVEDTGVVTESIWVFDANGQPIGASYEAESTCSYWGSTCGPIGTGTPLCSNGGAGSGGAAGASGSH